MGGGVLLQYWHLGDLGAPLGSLAELLNVQEEGPNFFFGGDSKTTKPVVAKKGLTLFN